MDMNNTLVECFTGKIIQALARSVRGSAEKHCLIQTSKLHNPGNSVSWDTFTGKYQFYNLSLNSCGGKPHPDSFR